MPSTEGWTRSSRCMRKWPRRMRMRWQEWRAKSTSSVVLWPSTSAYSQARGQASMSRMPLLVSSRKWNSFKRAGLAFPLVWARRVSKTCHPSWGRPGWGLALLPIREPLTGSSTLVQHSPSPPSQGQSKVLSCCRSTIPVGFSPFLSWQEFEQALGFCYSCLVTTEEKCHMSLGYVGRFCDCIFMYSMANVHQFIYILSRLIHCINIDLVLFTEKNWTRCLIVLPFW